MSMDREQVLQLMARRAGFTEGQVDALRRRDYAALLLEQPPLDARPEPPPAADAGAAAAAPSSADLQAALERVSQRLGTVRRQRDAALQLLRQVAARLGCCPDCWGSEPECPRCGGLGSPGWSPPDADLLDWLGPALDRLTTGGHEPARGQHER